ncbi:polysaccharide deacetylase family protein [Lysinibacillus piscis]|uniref:NodB homology domain-containing protein n=1 Tax=Lysinibacillus piscis TaxID=2518931 RepID=A0ABQ5NLQ7_9BACI|nr:polysaccharide deacetylase family protein [Lysinibacillus sp. KH24]GLC88969.1 hypothetical protein LYSBPC_20960 [Lysinibacillus sp. KH24]
MKKYVACVMALFSMMWLSAIHVHAENKPMIQQIMFDTVLYTEASATSERLGDMAQGSYVLATPVNVEWTHIQTPQLVGYVATAALKNASADIYVVGKKGGTHVVTYPSPSAQVIGELYENSMAWVYGVVPGGWSFVYNGHAMGYVATASLKKPSVLQKQVHVKNGAVLRQTPSPSGETIGTVPTKTIVQQYTVLAGWAYIVADEQQGYVKATDLSDLVKPDNKIYNKGVTAGKGMKKRVALTFDDGPDAKVTPQILTILKKYNSKATFFMVGRNVAKNPALVQQIDEAGHEIGNHTWNHSKLTSLSVANVKQEIERTSNAIYEVIGQYPTVFRPPYGATDEQIRATLVMPTILWSIDTLDWKHRNAAKILHYVQASVKDGSIILMHDIHLSTAQGLENVIIYLQKQGYELVTVSEILQ